MQAHQVRTHLQAADGVGRFTIRQLFLGGGALAFVAPQAWERVPAAGVSLADLIRPHYPMIGAALGSGGLDASKVGAVIASLVPFGILMLPLDPAPEHGLLSSAGWLRERRQVEPEQVAQKAGRIKVRGDVAESDYGYHAVWELPTKNLRLADPAEVEVAQTKWGEFLNGLSCPIQDMVIADRQDVEAMVHRFDTYQPHGKPWPAAQALSAWLRWHVMGRKLIERRHLIATYATEESDFEDSVREVQDGLSGLGFRIDQLRRVEGDDLRAVIDRTWSHQAVDKPSNSDVLGPADPWHNSPRQLQSDGQWYETMALGRWPRVIRDNWMAPLADGLYDCDVIMHIEPLDPDKVKGPLETRLQAMKSVGQARKRQLAIEDLDAFVQALESGTEVPFDVQVLLRSKAGSRQQVRSDAKRLQKRVQRSGAKAYDLRWEQGQAMLDSAPLGMRRLQGRTKRVDTSTMMRAHLLSASTCWPEGGVPIGETLDSNRLVGWTPWRRPLISNPTLAVYAYSGGGKGFAVKVVLSRLLFAGETQELFAIDQAEEDGNLGEYGRWATYIGAEYRHVRSVADFDAAFRDLNDYRWLGPGLVWNIAKLPLVDRAEFMHELKARLWLRAAEHPARRQIAIDEMISWVKTPNGADPAMVLAAQTDLEDIARRGRHVQLGGVYMTQRVLDAIKSDLMQNIQAQAASQIYGPQLPKEITESERLLQWTPAEVSAIKTFIPGQCLLAAGPWRVALRVTSSDAEYAMANTDGKPTRDTTQPTDHHRDDTDDANGIPDSGAHNGHLPALAIRELEPAATAAR